MLVFAFLYTDNPTIQTLATYDLHCVGISPRCRMKPPTNAAGTPQIRHIPNMPKALHSIQPKRRSAILTATAWQSRCIPHLQHTSSYATTRLLFTTRCTSCQLCLHNPHLPLPRILHTRHFPFTNPPPCQHPFHTSIPIPFHPSLP